MRPDADMMADLAPLTPSGWTVEHLDNGGYPSQGWGSTPDGLRWYFRDRHGRWSFTVGPASAGVPEVPDPGRMTRATSWGGGRTAEAGEIVAMIADAMSWGAPQEST